MLWQQPIETPAYAAVTYDNGVVFAPATTSFDVAAFNADSGLPLWTAPTGAAVSSGASIVGRNMFFGSGTSLSSNLPFSVSAPLPPQLTGIWSYGVATAPALP